MRHFVVRTELSLVCTGSSHAVCTDCYDAIAVITKASLQQLLLRCRWDYSETIREALGRLFTSRRKVLAVLDADRSHVLDLIKEAQRYFEDSAQTVAAAEETASRSVEDVGDSHRRKTLRTIADRARRLALRATEQQRNKRAETLQVASTITSSIVADMVNRLVSNRCGPSSKLVFAKTLSAHLELQP